MKTVGDAIVARKSPVVLQFDVRSPNDRFIDRRFDNTMPIFRWGQNWSPLRDLEREVESLLKSVNLTFQSAPFGHRFPAVNLYERETDFLLTAEVPGTRTEDLDLTVENGVLIIRGTRSDADDIPDDRFRRRERFHGGWERSLRLPERVRDEEMSADLINGILRVRLPKHDVGQPRRIPVVDGEQ